MLIKTQEDKIVNTKFCATIEKNDINPRIVEAMVYGIGTYYLGGYKTEKRADEIVSEIWDKIDEINPIFSNDDSVKYLMPKE